MTQADCVWNKPSLTIKGRGKEFGKDRSSAHHWETASTLTAPKSLIYPSHHSSSLLLPADKKQAGEHAWERTQAHGCEKQEESSETRGSKADEGLIHPVASGRISDRAELLTAVSKPPAHSEKPHSDTHSSPESKEAEGFIPDRALCQAGCVVYSA